MKKSVDIFSIILIITLSSLFFSFFLNRSLSIYDEGYVLEGAKLLTKGKLPYKDFFFQYPPLTLWLGAIWFKLVGIGLINLRILALIISTLSVIAGYFISRRLAGRRFSLVVAAAIMVWGFPHANFLWPSSVATPILFSIILILIMYTKTKKSIYLFLSGAVIVLSLLNKQNIGIANLVGGLGYVLLLKTKDKKVNLPIFFGSILLFLSLSFLLINPSKATFLGLKELFERSLSVAKAEAFIFPYTLASKIEPGIYGFVKWLGKSFIYIYPAFIVLYSAFLSIRGNVRNNIWSLIFFTTSLHFLAVIWPLSDLAHLTFAIPSIILLSAAYWALKRPFDKTIATTAIVILMLIGFYKTFFMRYYTFETPYLLQTNKVEVEGKLMYLDDKHARIVKSLENLKNTMFKGKSVFVHPYAPMFYYLTDKEPPTYDLYTVSYLLSGKAIDRNIRELETNQVDYVILEPWREPVKNNPITQYVINNYDLVDTFWDYEVYKRK